jgi:hypothetical protein
MPRKKPKPPTETSDQAAPADKPETTGVEITADDGTTQAECEAALEAASVEFDWAGETEEEGCTVVQAVVLKAVSFNGSTITFPQAPVLSCAFAARLGRWTRDIAGPVVMGHAGSELAAVNTGPGLVCRRRVGGSRTKVSEHAKGNAIDIASFSVSDQRTLQIGSELDEAGQRALRAMRVSACGYFTTVLGPGANAAHERHFHFDYGKHGRTYNYRICE